MKSKIMVFPKDTVSSTGTMAKRPHVMAAATGAARKKHPVKAVLAGMLFSAFSSSKRI